ncbi:MULTISPECIES: O-antigen ligase family protein [unclassified Microcoleus]|uniref:O-antigen ligase family protein n=1 Tax=unclassified Microcoleus TaxID=2642155 RepID=UPI002FD2BCA8
MMPNLVAYVALIIWPLVTLAIFASMKPAKAVVWSLLAGYLLLPVKASFDFPGIPALDKTTIANLSTYVAAMIYTGGRSTRLPREWWLLALMAAYLVSPMMTALNNRDALIYGSLILPSLQNYDAFSAASYHALELIPFLLGYNLLRNPRHREDFLRIIVTAAIAYSILMIVEIRLSPQLHNWIYGFFPHFFDQQIRGGGFRPVVFLGHGLLVAIFAAMAIAACGALALRRQKILGLSFWVWSIYLLIILILCKSFGALLLALFALSFQIIIKAPRANQKISALVAIAVILYPALRGADLVPAQWFADQVAAYSGERSGSFQFRIDNEDQLLAKANQRPWFGWGGYGRNRVYDEQKGTDLSITDGTWIIVIGSAGWIGYLTTFGLICGPIVVSAWRNRAPRLQEPILNVILLINVMDLIPNSSLGPITWLLAGSILIERSRKHQVQMDTSKNRLFLV